MPHRALEFESEPTWEVDRIVGSARRHSKAFYKVQWEPTWEPAESLQGSADAAVTEFRLGNREISLGKVKRLLCQQREDDCKGPLTKPRVAQTLCMSGFYY